MIKWDETAMKKIIILFFALLIMASLAGCQKIKSIFIKPPPEGLTERSYTIRLMGYEQSVFVKAPPEDIFRFISNPEKLGLSMLQIGKIEGKKPEDIQPPEPGDCIPVNIRMFGINIKSRMISVKSSDEKQWMLVENPFAFIIQRWQFEPVKEGTRVNLRMDYEIPAEGAVAQLGRMVDLAEMTKIGLREVDLALARIQEYFDPALDAEELVKKGLRGEPYEAVLQAHEVKTWVNASPEMVEAWIINAENAAIYLKELKMEQDIIRQFKEAPSGGVVHSRATLNLGAIRMKTDVVGIKYKKAKHLDMCLYLTFLGNIGLLEMEAKPEAGGSLLNSRMVFEIPSSGSAEGMEMLLFVTGIPRLLQERVLMIKRGVEGIG
jgi:ribosome-associated toxin RatA of RatAB toxin-antitoxin module